MNKRITKEPAVLILAAGYILFFSLISILHYHTFDYNDFDLAIHTQTVWNILHGSIYSSYSILDCSGLCPIFYSPNIVIAADSFYRPGCDSPVSIGQGYFS